MKGDVKLLPEHDADIGRALTQKEQDRLFQVAASKPRWEPVYCAAVVAGNTTMRSVEVRHLRRRDVDLFATWAPRGGDGHDCGDDVDSSQGV